MLVAIFDRFAEDLVRQAQRIEDEHREPAAVLSALVRHDVDFALVERPLVAVYVQEERSLDPPDHRRIRKRQRLYVEHWVRALRKFRPQLGDAEALTLVHAAIHVISSIAFCEPGMERGRLRAVLVRLVERTLRDP